jgi:hypothetical protein
VRKFCDKGVRRGSLVEFRSANLVPRSLVADGSLKPQIGTERSWRDLDKTLGELRDRRIAGKAVFRID